MNTRDPRFGGVLFFIAGMAMRYFGEQQMSSPGAAFAMVPGAESRGNAIQALVTWAWVIELGLAIAVLGIGMILVGFLAAAIRPRPAE